MEGHVEVPSKYLPDGVGPASWSPSMLRVAAEAYRDGRLPVNGIKPWTMLMLLDGWEAHQNMVATVEAFRHELEAHKMSPTHREGGPCAGCQVRLAGAMEKLLNSLEVSP